MIRLREFGLVGTAQKIILPQVKIQSSATSANDGIHFNVWYAVIGSRLLVLKTKLRKPYSRKYPVKTQPCAREHPSTFVSSNRKQKNKMKTIKTVIAAAVMLASSFVNAQDSRPMHEIYSMMVFNFVKYVQWPTNDNSKEFVIGVVGNTEIYNTLSAWYSGKPKGNKTYVIKKFNSASEVTDCQVVFIDRSKSNEFDAVNNKVKGKGTLVVTDRNGLGSKGSCINFKTVDEKLKFELNQSAIEASNLKVSSALSSMAILI